MTEKEVRRLKDIKDEIAITGRTGTHKVQWLLDKVEEFRTEIKRYAKQYADLSAVEGSNQKRYDRAEAEVKRLQIENEKLKFEGAKTHPYEYQLLLEQEKLDNVMLREMLEPMRKLLISLRENGSSHAFFIMQQAWGDDMSWDESMEMINSLKEAIDGRSKDHGHKTSVGRNQAYKV